jgi:hypothetical protein
VFTRNFFEFKIKHDLCLRRSGPMQSPRKPLDRVFINIFPGKFIEQSVHLSKSTHSARIINEDSREVTNLEWSKDVQRSACLLSCHQSTEAAKHGSQLHCIISKDSYLIRTNPATL